MDENEFISKISGEIRISPDGMYPYFQPHDLPFEIKIKKEQYALSRKVLVNLARLDGKASEMSQGERDNFVKAFTMKESTHSSSIEGTRSTLDDLYRFEKESHIEEYRMRDICEVNNYKNALKIGLDWVSSNSEINIELLHKMHVALLKGTRGDNKSPGVFKTEQNAIGTFGDTIETAKMVPAPPESVDHLIDNLLEYINNDDEDLLIKCALAHYQFESIHPYRDGNGRIGRLLIMLLLAKEDVLRYPVLYPSGYFDKNRDEYIDRLFNVSSKDEFEEWIDFFLNAMNEQALNSITIMDKLKVYKKKLIDETDNIIERSVIDLLFSNPYIGSKDVVSQCHVTNPTALKTLANLERKGILREVSGRKRNLLYSAEGVLEILRSP